MAVNTVPAFNPNAAYSAASASAAPAFNPDASYLPADQSSSKVGSPADASSSQPDPSLGVNQAIADVGKGFVKGVGDSVSGVSHLLHKLPGVGETLAPEEGIKALDTLDVSQNTAQSVGKGIEGIAEFATGDEALEGVAKASRLVDLAQRYPLIARTLDLATQHPWLAKIITEGTKGAVTGGVQGAVKGAQQDEAGKGAAIGAAAGGVLGAVSGAVTGGVQAFKNLEWNPFRQITQGKSIAQAPAEAAIRESVGAGASEPILQGSKTVVDDPLSALATKEKAAYKAVDDAAGFDVKEAKLQLKNDQYAIQQLGNTPADQASRKALTESIQDSTQRIAVAEKRLTAAGIDPKVADTLHTARMAGTDFKNAVVRATTPDGAINVDKLLNQSKTLRFSKRGDRLAQFMGKAGADEFMSQLEAAQQAGVHALKAQKIAKWIGVKVLQGAGLAAGAEGVKSLLD